MNPESWADRLISFTISVVVAVLLLRFAWSEVQPLLPLLLGGLVVYGYFKWQRRR